MIHLQAIQLFCFIGLWGRFLLRIRFRRYSRNKNGIKPSRASKRLN